MMELLAPAGNMEKLKTAFYYGADACYLGGKKFGLRAFSGNFDENELKEAVDFAHSMGKKIYVTLNIVAHNPDFEGLSIEKVIERKNAFPFAIICKYVWGDNKNTVEFYVEF